MVLSSGLLIGDLLRREILGTLVLRARSHSPSALACASSRSDEVAPVAEQSSDEEVDRAEVGQFVTLDCQFACFGKEAPQFVDGQGRLEPLPRLQVAYPDAEIRVAALVAGAGMHDLTE